MNQAIAFPVLEETAIDEAQKLSLGVTNQSQVNSGSLDTLAENIRFHLDAWARHASASNGFGDLAG